MCYLELIWLCFLQTESNEIPPQWTNKQRKPFAHLMGRSSANTQILTLPLIPSANIYLCFPFTVQTFFSYLLVYFKTGCNNPENWVDNVVEWVMVGEAMTNKMKYEKGQLMIEEDGIYYLYSKLEFNVAKECDAIIHKMMKKTDAYGVSFELLRSKRYVMATVFISFVQFLTAIDLI